MTPSQIEEHARQRFNAVGSNFFSTAEILNLIYAGCLELTSEIPQLIERTYTTSTVADQQEYSYPTNTIAIKRITYDGAKLQPITMRDDDNLTLLDSSTTETGTPIYYFIWNETIYLRPIPSAVADLEIFSYNEPQSITASSTLEVPTQFHMDLVNYVVSEMYAKDQNPQMSAMYRSFWDKAIIKAKRWAQKRKRGDAFAQVRDENTSPITHTGAI